MTREDSELQDKYIRVKKNKTGVQILVCKIEWHRPAKMNTEWHVVKNLKNNSSDTEIEKEVARISVDHRFFKVCSDCGARKPVGLMWEKDVCQRCAADNHGVVF